MVETGSEVSPLQHNDINFDRSNYREIIPKRKQTVLFMAIPTIISESLYLLPIRRTIIQIIT